MGIKKANRINLKDLVYALLLKDDAKEVAYGEIKPFAKAMQMQLTPEVATGELYGDGVKQETISKLTGMTAVADVNKVPIDVRAEVNGNAYENGVLVEKEGDQAPYIALGYRVEQTNHTNEYIWLLKGKAQPYASTVQQATENINFSTDSITINFVPREFDGKLRKFGDSADETFTKEMAEAWFKEVGGGQAKPPLVEKATWRATGQEEEREGINYHEYELLDEEDTPISLKEGEVEYIKKDGTTLTPNTDSTLWFSVENETKQYNFEVKTKTGKIYTAKLDWTKP